MKTGKLLVVSLLFLLAAVIPWNDGWSGPFGFEYGMSKQQILHLLGKESLVKNEGDVYQFSTAPEPHPSFETYLVILPGNKGLIKLVAVSKPVETSVYGDQLRAEFDEIFTGLTTRYGKGEKYDFLREHLARSARLDDGTGKRGKIFGRSMETGGQRKSYHGNWARGAGDLDGPGVPSTVIRVRRF